MPRGRLLWLLLGGALLLACGAPAATPTPAPRSSAPTATFPSTIPTLTPTPDANGSFYPPGTRTGVEAVDVVLDAVEARDAAALSGLLAYYPLPCTPPGGLGDVACPAVEPAGSTVDVVGVSRCGGSYLPRGSAEASGLAQEFLGPGLDARVFGVLKRPLFGTAPQIPGSYLIVFASGEALFVGGEGVTYVQFACKPPLVAEEVLRVVELIPGPNDFLLHPR